MRMTSRHVHSILYTHTKGKVRRSQTQVHQVTTLSLHCPNSRKPSNKYERRDSLTSIPNGLHQHSVGPSQQEGGSRMQECTEGNCCQSLSRYGTWRTTHCATSSARRRESTWNPITK